MRARLYQRRDSPYWQAEFTTPSGEPDRRSTGCRKLGDAEEWLAARIVERRRAEAGIPVAQRISLELALAEYLTVREVEWSDPWRATMAGFWKHDVLPWFHGPTAVNDITRPAVERFRVAMVGRPKKRGKPGPISPASINRMMAGMAKFGNWCLEPGRAYALANPWAGHAPFAEDQRAPATISEEDYAAWRARLPEKSRGPGNPRVRAIVTLAVETGLRKSELGRLRRNEVDLAARMAWVVSVRLRGLTKSRQARPVVLTELAAATIEALPERADGLLLGPIPDIRKSMRTAAAEAGLGRDVWFHITRHFGASLNGAQGASDRDLQGWGGWTSGKMLRRYDHSGIERLRALAERRNVARISHAPEPPASIEKAKEEPAPQPPAAATETVDPTGIEPVTF